MGDKREEIIIAPLDTGYDPGHSTRPVHLRTDLQHDFVAEDGTPDKAADRTPPIPWEVSHEVRETRVKVHKGQALAA